MRKIFAIDLLAASIAVQAADIEQLDQVQVEQDQTTEIDEANKALYDMAKAQVFLEMLDHNKDGKLDLNELLSDKFQSHAELNEIATAKSLINRLDRDGDGELDLDEFANWNQEQDLAKTEH